MQANSSRRMANKGNRSQNIPNSPKAEQGDKKGEEKKYQIAQIYEKFLEVMK